MAFLSPLILSANLGDADQRQSGDDLRQVLLLVAAQRMLCLWHLLDHRQLVPLHAVRHVWLLLVLPGSTSSLSS